MGITQIHDYIDHKREPLKIEIFERVADGLHIPGELMGLSRRAWEADESAQEGDEGSAGELRDADDVPAVNERQIALKAVIRQRHLSYEAFCREWDRTAKSTDDSLRGHYPGRAQYYRWLRGGLANKRPYPDACKMLEAMFPGWTVERLFSPYTEDEGPQGGNQAESNADSIAVEGEFRAQATLLQAARFAEGWSQEKAMGELTNFVTGYDAKQDMPSPAEINSQFGISFNPAGMADRMSELANWAEATNISDGALSYLDSATFQLAHDCLTVPPFQTGERAYALVERIRSVLRSGRQRLGQTRDLYVIAGKLCAILSWISSDLGELALADSHARNGWTLADQADHDGLRALLLSARSKIDFWRRRYGEAAKHARRGYEYNPPGTLRVLLACQEADALQAIGKIEDAMEALTRSERTQDAIRTQDDVNEADELGGIFGCGIARQSNYSIATYLRSGSMDQALLQVHRAETAWRDGEEWAYGTWAQVQIGAAIAHLMNGEMDGAALILRRILDEPAEKRLATLTTRLHREVTPLLTSSAIGQSKLAFTLREGISDYSNSPIRQLPSGVDL
jgi:tetratricopeptide (TPR) repeat protein